jgi:hypothetical protein
MFDQVTGMKTFVSELPEHIAAESARHKRRFPPPPGRRWIDFTRK